MATLKKTPKTTPFKSVDEDKKNLTRWVQEHVVFSATGKTPLQNAHKNYCRYFKEILRKPPTTKRIFYAELRHVLYQQIVEQTIRINNKSRVTFIDVTLKNVIS